MPLSHPPGHAQADFGEAWVVLGDVEQKEQFFTPHPPHSDACFIRAFQAAKAEAWVDGHVHAFAFFGGVPTLILMSTTSAWLRASRGLMPERAKQNAKWIEHS